VKQAFARARILDRSVAELEQAGVALAPAKSFANALAGEMIAVVAEVKRASPSRGAINPGMSAGRQARAYADGGAAAISVLTESTRFAGGNADLGEAAAATSLPILRKDFHVTPVQLLEARALGAAAALIIVRALGDAGLDEMAACARKIGLDIVFEVRDEAELDSALAAGARIIGVNNRNLETLEIDMTTVQRVLPLVPSSCVAIAESGYSTVGDVEAAARAGADAVLVGSMASAAADPAAAVRAIASVSRIGGVR